MGRRRLAILLGALFATACSFLVDSENLAGEGRCANCTDASLEGATEDDARAEPDGAKDGGDVDSAADAFVPKGCNAGALGAAGVDAGTFCIDETEVTIAQYAEFIAAVQGDTGGQQPECTWNSTYVPNASCDNAPSKGNRAIVGVDWCDAVAYCRWAGKRLCGRIGGGPLATAELNAPTADQWYAGCSNFGESNVPVDAAACNLAPAEAGGPVESTTCTGGVGPTLRDMIGNATEWSDSCVASDAAPQSQTCRLRGGSYESHAATCGSVGGFDRNARVCTVGFRCCSDP